MIPPRARAALAALAAAAALLVNEGWQLHGLRLDQLFRTWRSFDDFAIAAGYAARRVMPVAPYRVRDYVRRDRDPRFRAFREHLEAEVAARDIRPAAFWRAFPPDALSEDNRWLLASRFDDSGRALFLGILYRAGGGAAPYLLFWLAVLAAAPAVAWTLLEMRAAGHAAAGAVFVAALALSAFVLDVLALGYSAAGFHVVALLALVALATYAVLGTPTPRGLLVRAVVSGLVVGGCTICRGTVPFLLPGFALALLAGFARAMPDGSASTRGRLRMAGAALAALAVVVIPALALGAAANTLVDQTRDAYGHEARPQYHDAALLVWKGLGDFDRTKGYHFRDKAGEEAILRVDPETRAHRDSEVLLRDFIVRDVRTDPAWMAGILLKRFLATVSMYKLWPWGPLGGSSYYPATTLNEGVIDTYYTLTRQADWLALGPWSVEAPVLLLVLPLAVLLAAAAVPVTRMGGLSREARRVLLLVACVALAVLPVPVIVTTATALETECFVLVHFLALAFVAEGLAARLRAARRATARAPEATAVAATA